MMVTYLATTQRVILEALILDQDSPVIAFKMK